MECIALLQTLCFALPEPQQQKQHYHLRQQLRFDICNLEPELGLAGSVGYMG